jgi:hypothetical protein
MALAIATFCFCPDERLSARCLEGAHLQALDDPIDLARQIDTLEPAKPGEVLDVLPS